MKLYYFKSCRFCQRVLATIDELGIQNKIEFLDILDNPEFGDELEKMTDRRQVPCLVIDGKPMFESMDIIAYLREKFA